MAVIKLGNSNDFDKVTATGLVLVDFYADWCGPCKMIAPMLDQISASRDDVQIIKVDVDEMSDLQARFNVMSIPTLILFKDGEVVDQKLGFVAPDQLNAMIDQAK